ncbi:hypothetical protein DFP72DRAFT_795641, partial [Ephemerocybe angulata]
LFDSITFHLSPSLRHGTRDLLQHVLLANGATAAATLGDATHVITNSNRYEGWEGVGADVAVVTEKWVERSLLLGKLQPPSFYSADPDMIFSGVMATATDPAAGARETIGTLAWLYHVQATGVVSRPMDQLLHYPVPERRVEGFGGHV